MITLTPELETRVIAMIADDLANNLRHRSEELECLTMEQGAAKLNVSVQAFRRLVSEYVDLGERTQRVSVRHLNEIIERRTIRKRHPN